MDIAFTITVWIILVALTVHGLRLTQRVHAAAPPAAQDPAPVAPLPDHPVSSSAPAGRELVGAGS